MTANLRALARCFLKKTGGNVAVIMALSAIPLTLAMGAGIDYARGLAVHSNMSDALDSAALAVGAASGKPSSNCTSDGSSSTTTGNGSTSNPTPCSSMQQIAQQYFNANFKPDSGSDSVGKVSISIANESVTLSVADQVPTTFLQAAGKLLGSTALNSMGVSASSTVVWGQTQLWVSLVLDNSGSMADNGKMTALKSASTQLLTTLQSASQNPGDVEVAIVPFTNDVNVGTSYVTSSALNWTNWSAQTTDTTDISDYGPGDDCPYSYGCRKPDTNTQLTTMPTTGSTKGYICPWSYSSSSYTDGSNGHYFMGCFSSTATGKTATVYSGTSSRTTCSSLGFSSSNCSCSTSRSTVTCKTATWTHAWVPETDHSLWQGCITDRTQDYDIENTSPSGASGFTADNNDNCPDATVTTLGYNWTSLASQINAMQPSGSTNQAIGLAHGWQMLTPGAPYSTPAVPNNTTLYIILLSDGLNTQDRWNGNGMTENTTQDANIDAREKLACANAQKAGVVIYSLYVNINGSDGDSVPLQNCATGGATGGKYFVVTSASQIATDFASIAQQITNVRVSK